MTAGGSIKGVKTESDAVAAIMQAIPILRQKYRSNSQIERVTGIPRERLPKWEDGSASELKYIEMFERAMHESGLSASPDAVSAVANYLGPTLSSIERRLTSIEAQRELKIVVAPLESSSVGVTIPGGVYDPRELIAKLHEATQRIDSEMEEQAKPKRRGRAS